MRKRNGILFLIILILSVGIPYVVKIDMENNYITVNEEQILYQNNKNFHCYIDQWSLKQYIEVKGWGFNEDNTQGICTGVGLLDESTKEVLIIPAILEERPDVNEVYKNQQNDYTNCGFYGKITAKIFNIDHTYKLLLFFGEEKEICFDTGKGIVKGGLVNA